jgi:hypothetical protein
VEYFPAFKNLAILPTGNCRPAFVERDKAFFPELFPLPDMVTDEKYVYRKRNKTTQAHRRIPSTRRKNAAAKDNSEKESSEHQKREQNFRDNGG